MVATHGAVIITLMVWIGLWTKLRVYILLTDPFRWSCQGVVSLCRAFMMSWMLMSRNDLKVSHRKKLNHPSNMKLETSLMNFSCHTYGIFEGLSHHREDEVVSSTIFEYYLGLGNIINKSVSSNLLGMVISVSVIFDTGATY